MTLLATAQGEGSGNGGAVRNQLGQYKVVFLAHRVRLENLYEYTPIFFNKNKHVASMCNHMLPVSLTH